jgi:hypothetical protein
LATYPLPRGSTGVIINKHFHPPPAPMTEALPVSSVIIDHPLWGPRTSFF